MEILDWLFAITDDQHEVLLPGEQVFHRMVRLFRWVASPCFTD